MSAIVPDKETVDLLMELGGETCKICFQCGTCTATCPWNLVRTFSNRRMMYKVQLGVIDFADEDLWTCAACGACVKRCPRGVANIDVTRALRKVISEVGAAKVPDSLRLSVKNIATVGNPQGEAEEKRGEWAEALGVKPFTPETEVIYFSCCVPAFDAKIRRIAQSTVEILNKAGIDFGIMGSKERCCGESVRKVGAEAIFLSLAQGNIETFSTSGVKKVVVSSPHCYHTFKNEYPEFGAEFEVIHFVQLLDQLIEEGKLTFSGEVKKKVIYHDPCFLGRHNDIYDEPRRVLQAIPGVELLEFPDSRQNAICCGGGGGRIWMETPAGERFSELKLQQAIDAGAEVIAVACPYCMLMFDDSLLSMGKEGAIEIKDVSELVLAAI
ncbi:MAG: (Fe-S)-binding protein [Dehalococcoidia bacterium]|nr:MAG: (Fe-S)-binding protein [Dehalococcoidia bacterium]